MKRSCAVLLLWGAILAAACSAPDDCPGTWVGTDGGGVCLIATPDAGLDVSASPTCRLRGPSNLPSTRFDGLHMGLGPATVLGGSYYSTSGADLVARDGRVWWAETNDRCGTTGTMIWWGVQTFRFRGDADGRAVDLEVACEPWTYAATSARLLPCGEGLALCTQGHHPYRYVSCGRLGSVPGGLEPLDDLESPRSFIAGERSRGVILRWQHDETGEQGLRLYRSDGTLESSLELASTARPSEGLWVTELAGVPFLAKAGPPGTPLVIDRMGPGPMLLPSIEIDGFRTDYPFTPSPVVARDGDTRIATFLAEATGSDARIHLVVVAADGSWGSRPILQGGMRVVGAAYDARGHLIVLTERLEGAMMTHAELWRLGCDGTLLEEPLAVEAVVDMHPRALGIEPDASRAWIAFSVHDADDVQPGSVRPHYVHFARSVLLP